MPLLRSLQRCELTDPFRGGCRRVKLPTQPGEEFAQLPSTPSALGLGHDLLHAVQGAQDFVGDVDPRIGVDRFFKDQIVFFLLRNLADHFARTLNHLG